MEVSRPPVAPGSGPVALPRVPAPLAAPRPALPERVRRGWRRHWLDVALVVPLAAYILGFTLLPVLQSIALGFTARFSGAFPTLANYQDLVARPDFGLAVLNTVGITLIGVALELVVGLAIALMLARAFPLRGLFRTLVLVPMGVPTLVAGAAMIYIVGVNGYLNELLFRVGLIDAPIYWPQSGSKGMFVIALADMWKTTPIVVLILLAGLEAIPRDVYEAASVDGASAWRQFRDHTLPLLMPAITMAVILRAIDAFRIFDIALVLAGRSVPVMSTYVYFEYFFGNLNTAAAAATVLLVMIVFFVAGYFWLVERRREAV
jgi:trehalose transport system permease protein